MVEYIVYFVWLYYKRLFVEDVCREVDDNYGKLLINLRFCFFELVLDTYFSLIN